MPDGKFHVSAYSRHALETNIERFAENMPEVWGRMYSRIYDQVPHFLPTKMVAANLCSSLLLLELDPEQSLRSGNIMCACQVAAANIKCEMPVIHVSKELIADLLHTTPPDDLNWVEMELPFPGAVFLLEEGAFLHPSGAPTAWIAYGRAALGEDFQVPGSRLGACPRDVGTFTILTTVFGDDGAFDFHQTLTSNHKPVLEFDDLDAFTDKEPVFREIDDSVYQPEDKIYAAQYIRLLFNLLLVMEAEPELLQRGKTQGKRNKQGREFWSPYFLGRNYRYERVAGSGEATGIQVRRHWRKGHWTNQPYGPQSSLRKRIRRKSQWIGGVKGAG